MKDTPSPLGTHLKTARESLRLSRAVVAHRAKVSPQFLHRIECQGAIPSAAVCARLAKCLRLDLDDVLLWSGRVPPDLMEILRDHRDARAIVRRANAPKMIFPTPI